MLLPLVGEAKDPLRVEDLDRKGLHRVRLVVPQSEAQRYPMWLLLHGNQPTMQDRTWMARVFPKAPFKGAVLVVPGLPRDDYRWDRPKTASAVVALVKEVLRTKPVDPQSVFMLGYSAGGSRVLALANRMPQRIKGIVCVAGDIGRSIRINRIAVHATLRKIPVLLLCMTGDKGPNASCRLDGRNARLLRKRGFESVTTTRIVGGHVFDLPKIAKALRCWLR
jgi:poly(3-hydroxybutyrate) depolymerase